MQRRRFLEAAGRAAALSFSLLVAGCSSLTRRDRTARELLNDIEAMRARDYSETGVCMLLTGENLVSGVTRRQDLGGSRLARLLDRYVRRLEVARPDATADDVAAVVELVAEEDFRAAGQEASS